MKNSIRPIILFLTLFLVSAGDAISAPGRTGATLGDSSRSDTVTPVADGRDGSNPDADGNDPGSRADDGNSSNDESSAPGRDGRGDEEPPREDLDLLHIEIASPEVRSMLGTDRIPLRNPNADYRPTGEVPLPIFEQMDEDMAMDRLTQLQSRFGAGVLDPQGEVIILRSQAEKKDSHIMGEWLDHISRDKNERQVDVSRSLEGQLTRLQGYRAWVARASGSWKLTFVEASMARPSRIENVAEAARMALDQLALHQLVQLGEGESMDIVSASSVRNAIVGSDSPSRPHDQFTSDYYVTFGRRLHGIPVIGSRLVVRLNADGRIAAVEKSWREIVGYGEVGYRLSDQPMENLVRDAIARQNPTGEEPQASPPMIRSQSCGYMEAPGNASQQVLVPGCRILIEGDELPAEDEVPHDRDLEDLNVSLYEDISEESLFEVSVATLPFSLNPKITVALPIPFSGLKPGSQIYLKGYGFGTSPGRIFMHGSFPGSPVELVNVEWKSDTQLNGFLPSNLSNICVQEVFIQVETAAQITSNFELMAWHQESTLLNMSDVTVLECGNDANQNKCNTVKVPGEACFGSVNLPFEQILPGPGIAVRGYHRRCYYTVGYATDIDKYEITLHNGWTFADSQIQKKLPTSNEVIHDPVPPVPVGQSFWAPNIEWVVSPADEITYDLEVTVTGPTTCSHQ